mgnify:CR=1 FL=1
MATNVEIDVTRMWQEYRANPTVEIRNILIEKYLPLVKYNAERIWARLPDGVELDDLMSTGVFGLMDAIDAFDLGRGVKFETYCVPRIRGAMLDELREGDWMSRSSRKSQKDIEHAVHRLEQKLGRSPLESEIASEMGMSLVEYQSLLGKVRGTQLVYLEDMTHGNEDDDGFLDRHVADADADPLELLRDQRLKMSLVNAIKTLPEREQHIMGMYYEHDMNLKEIAAVLGVTESRVCQLHSQSIARLRAKMRSH